MPVVWTLLPPGGDPDTRLVVYINTFVTEMAVCVKTSSWHTTLKV